MDSKVEKDSGFSPGESVVAKRKMGTYREDRPDWLKIKNRTYSQAEGRHELLTRRGKGG